MVALLLTCLTIGLSLRSVWCFLDATLWGQQSIPGLTLPHVRDGLSVRRIAVLCPCSMLSMYRHGHRQCMRNALHNCTTLVPVTVTTKEVTSRHTVSLTRQAASRGFGHP